MYVDQQLLIHVQLYKFVCALVISVNTAQKVPSPVSVVAPTLPSVLSAHFQDGVLAFFGHSRFLHKTQRKTKPRVITICAGI